MASKALVVSERCTRSCSMHHENLEFADDLLVWYNDRKTLPFMIAEFEKRGVKTSPASLSRHRKHLEYSAESFTDEGGQSTVDHLRVLQAMITQGAKRSSSWRIGPTETLKAMDMYYRLTQGSAMKDLFAALTTAAAGDNISAEEFDAGSMSPAELDAGEAADE